MGKICRKVTRVCSDSDPYAEQWILPIWEATARSSSAHELACVEGLTKAKRKKGNGGSSAHLGLRPRGWLLGSRTRPPGEAWSRATRFRSFTSREVKRATYSGANASSVASTRKVAHTPSNPAGDAGVSGRFGVVACCKWCCMISCTR